MLRRQFLRTALLLAVVVLPTMPATGFAQICLGYASFAAGRVQVGASTSVATGVGSSGLSLAAGTRTIFGGLAIGIDYYSGEFPDPEGDALEASGRLGYQVQLGSHLSLCPIVSYRGQFGPRDLAVDATAILNRYSGGVGAGRQFPLGKSTALVPAATLFVARDADQIELRGATWPSNLTFVGASAGVGLVLGQRWTLRPTLAFPLTSRDRRLTTWGLSVAVNL